MHAAPPVRVALGRSYRWIAFVAVCGALAATQGLAWAAKWLEWTPGVLWGSAGAGALAAALTLGAWAWHAQTPGVLAFDGARWQWHEQSGRLSLAIDLQTWILLRFDPEVGAGRRVWVAASRRGVGAAWPMLRAALYSPAPDAAVDPPPPVTPHG
jgi:hypothetical protein